MADSLVINEIFLSLQGESTFAGLPCIFIRLTACDLRCSYCDTAYAFTEGKRLKNDEIVERVQRLAGPADHAFSVARRLPLVEVTGGEPMLQAGTLPLLTTLCDLGFTVLLETSGAHDVSPVDSRVHKIMDIKCPGSGESERNRWENVTCLKKDDEIKFVIISTQDYEWAKTQVGERRLPQVCPVLFSWAAPLLPSQQDNRLKPVPPGHTPISMRDLAERIIADKLPVRFQVQMHKVIWRADAKGV